MDRKPKNERVRHTDLTGAAAVDFELPDLDGQLVRLSDFSGSWLLLVFHRHLG